MTVGGTTQSVGLCNEAINKRALRTVDLSKAGINKIVDSIVSKGQLNTDFKATYQVLNTNYGVIYVSRLKPSLSGLAEQFTTASHVLQCYR